MTNRARTTRSRSKFRVLIQFYGHNRTTRNIFMTLILPGRLKNTNLGLECNNLRSAPESRRKSMDDELHEWAEQSWCRPRLIDPFRRDWKPARLVCLL